MYSLMSDLIDAERSGAGGVTRAEGEAGELKILGECGVVEVDAEVRAGPGCARHLPLAVSRQERAVLGLEGGKLLCRCGTSVVLRHDHRIGVGH